MRFRNYFPRDDDLQKAKHPPPVIPKFEDPVATDPLQVAGAEVSLDFAIWYILCWYVCAHDLLLRLNSLKYIFACI